MIAFADAIKPTAETTPSGPARSQVLTCLDLDGDQIGDLGMIEFSGSIASGSMANLKALGLGFNQIGDVGLTALSDAVGKGHC